MGVAVHPKWLKIARTLPHVPPAKSCGLESLDSDTTSKAIKPVPKTLGLLALFLDIASSPPLIRFPGQPHFQKLSGIENRRIQHSINAIKPRFDIRDRKAPVDRSQQHA